MRGLFKLCVLTGGLLSPLLVDGTVLRQATREEAVMNAYRRRSSYALLPRGSPAVCASGLVDDQNTCCPVGDYLTGVKDGSQCCNTHRYEPVCGEYACCPGGPSKIVTIDPEDENEFNAQMCCKAEEVVVDDNTPSGRCAAGSSKREKQAFYLASRPVRRDLSDDPLRQISFREDSSRITLSPHLVADMVLNDWSFEYRGRTFIDYASRQRGHSYWQRRIARRLPGFVKYGGALAIGRSIKMLHGAGHEYLPLAGEFEIKMSDIPLVWQALHDNPSFTGSFYLEGAEWDADIIKHIISSHPDWNATLHDVV